MAVRAALGAGRARLVRLLLAESLVLALAGAGLSVLVAAWSIALLKAGLPATITRFIPRWDELGVNRPVLLYTLAVAAAVTLLFGLTPALALSRTPVGELLKEASRALPGGGCSRRLRPGLVVVQVSLALVLLVGAGAVVQGFVRAVDPRQGIDPDGVLTAHVSLPESRYPDHQAITAFERRARAELRAIPGVEDAAAVNNVPWGTEGGQRRFTIDGQPAARPEEERLTDFRVMSPGYLSLLRVPMRAGAPFAAGDDRLDGEPVALVSESAARRYWPERDPVGSHLTVADGKSCRVVGVVGDVVGDLEHQQLRSPFPTLYVPYGWATPRDMYLVVRAAGDPQGLAGAIRAALARLDGELPVTNLQTFPEALAQLGAGLRLGAIMMSILAALALLLSAMGIYGVVAYLVEQRRREIGIRMALGARPRQVLALVMGRGARMTTLGVVLGLPVAATMVEVMSAGLSDLVERDLVLMGLLTMAVGGLALVGSYLPARRATRIEPMEALRTD
jgi:predicted permease